MAEVQDYEEIIARHRKEKKEMLAKAQKMKHAIPKGDKKKKKDITAEIEQMISDLTLKHEDELKALDITDPSSQSMSVELDSTVDSIVEADSSNIKSPLADSSACADPVNIKHIGSTSKVSKAQKRRNKKVEMAKEREKAIAEQEIENLHGRRHVEMAELQNKLYARQLSIYEIPSDGNCLYKAIEHQLQIRNMQVETAQSLRALTSRYLLRHKEDYIPFITQPDTGEMLSDEDYAKYCEDIVNTSTWGGQVEIQVLANICGRQIEVIQAEGPSIFAGDNAAEDRLIICYFRHAFGLGEHYNSVVPIPATEL